ncbi:GNAT family N-acetyltransferase [Sansalvadorimonas sp. 2012CJ34-2]|uniref:GNAT family N-acetyltransferase n=1 Tax=Parendozoicomonas callyspongiae TaxID=2942213 RepID=A0ABT0PJM4_9GAMM|nr:GNAT family N-acetyltransferase [Sansalvadorimonas sp. 2012CJ34-2]MCL6271595.1 GNAT family N-acetyltransferase [Sansalvadorimonas sp. 2012CJ34-2]
MQIRAVQPGDGQPLAELLNTLDNETRFMMMEPGERNTSTEEQEKHIEDFCTSQSKAMLIACHENTGEATGFIVGIGGNFLRNRHSLYCVIGIKQKYNGQGLGKKLMAVMLTSFICRSCFNHRS